MIQDFGVGVEYEPGIYVDVTAYDGEILCVNCVESVEYLGQ